GWEWPSEWRPARSGWYPAPAWPGSVLRPCDPRRPAAAGYPHPWPWPDRWPWIDCCARPAGSRCGSGPTCGGIRALLAGRRRGCSRGWQGVRQSVGVGYGPVWEQASGITFVGCRWQPGRLASQPQAGAGGGQTEAHAEQDISEGNQPLTISQQAPGIQGKGRSEERRVGKEGTTRLIEERRNDT